MSIEGFEVRVTRCVDSQRFVKRRSIELHATECRVVSTSAVPARPPVGREAARRADYVDSNCSPYFTIGSPEPDTF